MLKERANKRARGGTMTAQPVVELFEINHWFV